MSFSSPKRNSSAARGKAAWYSYYAGFSPKFVENTLEALALPAKSRLLDPWNGSGTTTEVANENGFVGVGYDINPAMVLVAKARLLTATIRPSHKSLCANILNAAKILSVELASDDPLRLWFQPSSASYLRKIEVAIQRLLVPSDCYSTISSLSDLLTISSLAAFFYVALFRVVRQLASRFGASNPTWMKVPEWRERARPSNPNIACTFRDNVAQMAAALGGPTTEIQGGQPSPQSRTLVEVGNSVALPENSGTAAAAICSPPYCTRIDYAIATRIELAVLGFRNLRPLREKMIGSAVIKEVAPDKSEATWGITCNAFLNQLAAHRSKASHSYYLTNHLQYFDSLYRSIGELDRVLQPMGECVMVVQELILQRSAQ